MKNLENAKINVIKKVLKIVGIVVVSGLVVVAGFEIFTSIYFNPHDVRLTNVTDTSFTVSWVTNYPKRGVVYYKEKDNILPGVLSWIGTGKAFDDRDVANAEKKCVDEFNKKAEVSEDFVVDTSNYNCESVKVSRLGSYYTHHVTVTNLEPGKEYYFRVGDGFVSWKRDMNQTYTFYSLEKEVKAPSPIFGKITNEEGQYVNDSIVYVKFINGYTKKESIYYSSVTADNGSWYLDGNNIRTIDGELMLVEGGQDTIQVHAQYKNFILTDAYEWVYGDSNIAYPDIVVSDTAEKDLSMNRGVVVNIYADPPSREDPTGYQKIYNDALTSVGKAPVTAPVEEKEEEPDTREPIPATGGNNVGDNSGSNNNTSNNNAEKFTVPSFITGQQEQSLLEAANSGNVSKAKEIAEVIGYGNAAKILGNNNGGVIDSSVLEKIGLAGDSSMSEDYRQTVIVSNMNAIAGHNTVETSATIACTGTSCEGKKYNEVYITPDGVVHIGTFNGVPDPDPGGGNGHDTTSHTIEFTFPVVNGVRQISSNFVQWLVENTTSVSSLNCTETECRVVLDAVGFDVDGLLFYALGKKDVSMATSVISPLYSGIAELFKDGTGIKLKTAGNKILEIKDSSLALNGLEGVSTTDKITVTDELRTIFPQLSDDNTVAVSYLMTLIENRKFLIKEYNKIQNDVGINKESGGNEICSPACATGEVCENKHCVKQSSEIVEKEYAFDCLEGSHREGDVCVPDATEKDCSYAKCQKGTKCVYGVCVSDSKVIDKTGTNNDDSYILYDSNAYGAIRPNNTVCVNPDGCDCKYSNVTIHVGNLGVCENEEVLNSAKDVTDDGIFSRGDPGETMYSKYSVLRKYFGEQASAAEELKRKAEDIQKNALKKKNDSNGQKDYHEKEAEYEKAVEVYNYYNKLYEDLKLKKEEVDTLERSAVEQIESCLEGGVSEKEYFDCVYGEDSVTYTPDVQGVSDSSTDTSSNSLGSGYITYLPEYGFFDLEIEGLVEGQKVEGGEGNPRIFYVEMNGKSGLQFPEDPDNPQAGEDIVLRANALDITYKKSAEVMTLNVKKGVNLISFSYLPQIQTNEYTKASDIVSWLRSKGVRAENLSYFSAGRWQGVGYVNGEITGNDFSITPGRGYLLYSLDDGQISIPGYRLTSSVPISLSMGWNLVGIHGYSKVYTARSLLNSINKVEGLTANNISWWPTSKGKYEGLQVTDGKEYGFDFAISPNNGYFIRINKFEPKDTSCGSLLWQEGGTHNGVCGDSKTM